MKILIVGYGSIAQKHVNALDAIYNENEIWAITRDELKYDERIQFINDYDNIPEDIDFIIISNPTSEHLTSIKKLLKIKKPIFIEKPLSNSLEGLNEIASKLLRNKIPTYVACVLRFHPCLVFLKKYLTSNRLMINEVNVYCGSYLPEWRGNSNFRNSYSAVEKLGGGVHLDLFHEIDYSVWLFGEPNTWKCNHESKSSLEIDSIDNSSFIFKYDHFNLNISLNYFRRIPKRKIEIIFENSHWEIDLLKSEIIENDSKIVYSSNFTLQELYILQLKYFINHIKNEIQIDNNFEYSSNILKYCFA